MSLANFLDSKLFNSKINIYIVWIIATLLYLRDKVVPVINLSPIDLALQAGLIYGYYFTIIFVLRLLAFPLLVLPIAINLYADLVKRVKQFNEDEITDDQPEIENSAFKIAKSLQDFIQKIIQVFGILIVFLYHPESLVYTIAPIGLILVLFLYIMSSDDDKAQTIVEIRNLKPVAKVENSPASPMFVEIVNSNENPVEIKNSTHNPLHVDAGHTENPLPVTLVSVVYGNTLSVNVVKSVALPVEVINIVTTQQDDN
jgi:hypothetical protein